MSFADYVPWQTQAEYDEWVTQVVNNPRNYHPSLGFTICLGQHMKRILIERGIDPSTLHTAPRLGGS